ncbi:hypothetical protein [Micromonospora sp. CB01531]|uniref:hypothetical protein n=1 Tax=Micromonospora sp. CB01531 TaxID=1718947 RepID=UPI00093A24F5|nr:hypothetical protein [Micromonospora sp. CB01531]OKI45106.1 hypothetical protein A6A27_11855 [Micromonospora sp. CB01531]
MPETPETPETPVTETPETPPAETPETPETETPETPETPEGESDGTDELPEWARKKLTKANAEAANYRTRLREAETKLSAAKTVEEFEVATKELREANAALEHQLLVRDVAETHGLPKELAARLMGNTKEELEADAKQLKKFAVTPPPSDLRGGLDPSDDSEAFDPVKAARQARRSRY